MFGTERLLFGTVKKTTFVFFWRPCHIKGHFKQNFHFFSYSIMFLKIGQFFLARRTCRLVVLPPTCLLFIRASTKEWATKQDNKSYVNCCHTLLSKKQAHSTCHFLTTNRPMPLEESWRFSRKHVKQACYFLLLLPERSNESLTHLQ